VASHDDVGGWKKLRIENIHTLYSSPDVITTIELRRMRWAEEMRNSYKVLFGKSEGNGQLGRKDPKDTCSEDVEWIQVAQDKVPGSC